MVNLKIVAEEPQNDQSDDDAGPTIDAQVKAPLADVGAVVQASSIARSTWLTDSVAMLILAAWFLPRTWPGCARSHTGPQ